LASTVRSGPKVQSGGRLRSCRGQLLSQLVQCIEAITTVFRALLETLHIVTLFKMACNGFT
jgi:hypothetical protein